VVVLLFLGTIGLLGLSVLTFVIGAAQRSKLLAAIGGATAVGVATAYFIVLCALSLLSSDVVLPPGGWKVICEIDCHTWYSVVGTRTASTLGPEMQQTSAREQFVIVKLKTWFK